MYYRVAYLEPSEDGKMWTSEFETNEPFRRFWPTEHEAYVALLNIRMADIHAIINRMVTQLRPD